MLATPSLFRFFSLSAIFVDAARIAVDDVSAHLTAVDEHLPANGAEVTRVDIASTIFDLTEDDYTVTPNGKDFTRQITTSSVHSMLEAGADTLEKTNGRSPRPVPSEVDVVIVGAGYAGLSAARDLVAAGLRVAVLEGLDRAGGRTLNQKVPGVGRDRGGRVESVEVGGQWLGTRDIQPDAWQLIVDELGFEVFTTPHMSSNHQGGHGVTSTSKGTRLGDVLGALDWANAAEMAGAVLAATKENIALELPGMDWFRDELDAMTLADWMHQKGVDGDAAVMLEASTCGCGENASKIGALGVMQKFGAESLLTGGDPEAYRIKGGLVAPVLAMAEELRSIVHFDSQVVAIDQDEDMARVVAQQNGVRVEVHAPRVLFSGAPYTNLNINFTPPLPQEKREVVEKLKNGQTVKASLVYDRPFWRDSNLSGTIVNLVNLPDNFTVCIDNTPPDSNLGYMLCLAQADFGRKLVQLSADERRDRASNFVTSHLGGGAALIWYTDFDWESQPLIQGGCSGFWPPSLGANAHALNEDFGHVSWIGSDLEAQPLGHRGYVDDAIRTGRGMARRLISELVAEEW